MKQRERKWICRERAMKKEARRCREVWAVIAADVMAWVYSTVRMAENNKTRKTFN